MNAPSRTKRTIPIAGARGLAFLLTTTALGRRVPQDRATPAQTETTKRNRLLPMAGLDVNLAGLDVGYAFQLDTRDVGQSNHHVWAGSHSEVASALD